MRKSIYKLMAFVLTFASVMAYYTIPANAAELMNAAKVRLSDPRPATSSSYTFNMETASAQNLLGIKMSFLTAPTGGSKPANINLAAASLTSTNAGMSATDWAIDASDAASGILYIGHTGDNNVNGDVAIQWVLGGITNPTIAADNCAANPTNSSSGSCYIQIDTYESAAKGSMTTAIDTVTVGFTVNSAVQVRAKVDPSLTFTVVGVAGSQTAADTDDTVSATTAGITSTYDTLPFGNMTPNTAKVLAHDLTVKTNANSGYYVYVRMETAMTGTYGANNIDPFDTDGAGTDHTWLAPATWEQPDSTTKNVDSGFLGCNTPETDIPGMATPTNKWGPLNGDTTNPIMYSSGPDLGTSATRISYALEVNVYQPSDQYTGTMVYNVVPTY